MKTNMYLIQFVEGISGQIPRETLQHTNTLSRFGDSFFDMGVKRQIGIKYNPQMFVFSYFFTGVLLKWTTG